MLENYPDFRLFFDLLDSPRIIPAPAIPVEAQYSDRLAAEVQKAGLLEQTPQEALDLVQQEIEAAYDTWRTENL